MFVVNGVIGEGGFGRVLTALFVKNNNWYAIKEIKKTEIMKHKTGLTMLSGELSALKRVEHPFIVSLHFAFQDTNHLFLVMDLKTGGDLRYYLKKKLIFEERDVAFYVSCISSALNHLHSRNIIHRDVKPENIILDERGYPHLADFGVAHVQPTGDDDPLTTNLASGTKQYLAPEVFTQSHLHGPESDFWSLGVVAYELLHGRRPFEKHCPIPYITYLEKALKDKKLQQKELMRIKSMSFSSSSPSTVNESCVTGSTTGNISPVNCSSARNSASGPSGSGFGGGKDHRFPAIGHTSSTDGTSRGSSIEKSGYCSSVSYTPIHTANQAVSPMPHHHSLSVGIAGHEFESIAAQDHLQQHGNHHANHPHVSGGGHLSLDLPPACHSPKGSFRCSNGSSVGATAGAAASGGSGTGAALPMLSPKAGKSPFIRPMGRLSEGNESSRELQCLFTPRNSDGVAEDNASAHTDHSGTHHASAAAAPTAAMRPLHQAPPHCSGDLWLVDEGDLPESLVFSLPQGNAWLGDISPECNGLLQGLFEIRPSHRLGARNISLLKNHPFLLENHVSNWLEMQTKQFQPHFRPGKKFIKEIMEDQKTVIMDPIDDPLDSEEHVPLTDAQNAMFKEIHYVAPAYVDMITNDEEFRSILVCKDKHTLERESAKQQRSPEKVATSGHHHHRHQHQQQQQHRQDDELEHARDKDKHSPQHQHQPASPSRSGSRTLLQRLAKSFKT